MKYKAFACCLTIFSFFAIGQNTVLNKNNSDYYKVENYFTERSEFIENGVKLQYCTNNNKEQEIERITEVLKKDYSKDEIIINGNEITVNTVDMEYKICLWQESENIIVEATLINSDFSKSTQKIKKEIEKLQKEHLKNIRYFEYYKGKINTVQEGIDELELCTNIKEYKILKIENGITSTVTTKNGNKLNIALNEYDTGAYLVIGTPTIFATY